MNTLPSTGQAWPELEEKVDSFVEALIAKNNLPGMTVAVTKEGRLLSRRATATLSWMEQGSYR
jgi:hypothetical protein